MCELNPRVFVGDPLKGDSCRDAISWHEPVVTAECGCSHHPDFPAWLAEWKAERRREEASRNPP
jgi:hypothetical protein